MAFWNAPIPVNEHPDKAVAAAQAIQQAWTGSMAS